MRSLRPQALKKIGKDRTVLLLCLAVFLSYLPEAGQYSCFFVYLRLVRAPAGERGGGSAPLHVPDGIRCGNVEDRRRKRGRVAAGTVGMRAGAVRWPRFRCGRAPCRRDRRREPHHRSVPPAPRLRRPTANIRRRRRRWLRTSERPFGLCPPPLTAAGCDALRGRSASLAPPRRHECDVT